MNKKIMFLLLCLIAMLSVSAVSAIDNVTEENVGTEVAIEDTSYAVTDNSESNENTKGNFTELQEKIKNTPSGGVCDLDKDYEFIEGESTINIDKPMTLDGHNYTIDGKFKSNILLGMTFFQFNITSDDVIIKNINLLGGNKYINYNRYGFDYYDYTGINWTGNNGCLYNVNLGNYTHIALTGNHITISKLSINNESWIDICGFDVMTVNSSFYNFESIYSINNKIHGNNVSFLNSTGSIYIEGDGALVSNSIGGFYIEGNNTSILNSNGSFYVIGDNGTFKNIKINNNTYWDAYLKGNNGIILNLTCDSNKFHVDLSGKNITLLNSIFSKNKNWLSVDGENCKIINCSFIDNIYNILLNVYGINTSIINSTFINNSVNKNGVLSIFGDNTSIINSMFINNTGKEGGAIYINGNNTCINNAVFINNSAEKGSAIYTYYDVWGGDKYNKKTVLIINNTVFLSNKRLNSKIFAMINDGDDYGISVSFRDDELFNAMDSSHYCEKIFNNITYWGINGLTQTNLTYIKNGGINFTFEVYDANNTLVKNITSTTNEFSSIWLDYRDLATGYYTLKVYHKDDAYRPYSEYVTKIYIYLSVPDLIKYYNSNDKLVATVCGGDWKPVLGEKVEFKINGKSYIRYTDNEGKASMNIGLNSGTYKVETKYSYHILKSRITINPTVEAQDLVKTYQNDTQFYAKFLDINGKALAKTKVQFNINGVFYTRETNSSGVAKLSINLRPGNYILTAINPANDEQIGYNVTVKSLVEANNLTKYYKNESKFQATIYDKKGSLAINKEIMFNINGVFYKRTTDSNGVASMKINLRPGNYVISTIVDGLSIGNNVNVLPTVLANDLDMKFQDGSKFKATILDGQGKPLANQNVTFNVNGVFYSKITDANGVASLTINLNRGEYIITSMWNDYQVGNKITIS